MRALPIQVFLMESSSWSLPHGRRCRFIVVRVRLHESSRRSRRPLSKGMVGAVHRECAPGGAAPPPFASNRVSFFSRLPKIQKRTFWGHSVNLSGLCCVPLGKASFSYPNVTSIICKISQLTVCVSRRNTLDSKHTERVHRVVDGPDSESPALLGALCGRMQVPVTLEALHV